MCQWSLVHFVMIKSELLISTNTLSLIKKSKIEPNDLHSLQNYTRLLNELYSFIIIHVQRNC